MAEMSGFAPFPGEIAKAAEVFAGRVRPVRLFP